MNPYSAVLLEFKSHDKEGKTIDVSKRNKYVRQLDVIKDAEIIGRYTNAIWVLNGQKRRLFMSQK